jgi:hypothetical protein
LHLQVEFSFSIHAQKREFFSAGIIGEIYNSEKNNHSGYSFSYENQLCKNHGFEIGYNKRSVSYLLFNEKFQDSKRIKHNYISLPVLYKFYNPILTISAGFNIDYNVGWSDITKNTNSDIELEYSESNPRITAGWYLKLGKPIQLSTKVYIEPEVHFNSIFGNNYYYGSSIKLKYSL